MKHILWAFFLLASSTLATTINLIEISTGQNTDFALDRTSVIRSSAFGRLRTYTVTFNGKMSRNSPFSDVKPQTFLLTLLSPKNNANVSELRFAHQGWLNPAYTYSSSYFLGQFLRECLKLPEQELETIVVSAGTSAMPNSSATATKKFRLVSVVQQVVYNKNREQSSAVLTVRLNEKSSKSSCKLERR
jgi:hypothetical protein